MDKKFVASELLAVARELVASDDTDVAMAIAEIMGVNQRRIVSYEPNGVRVKNRDMDILLNNFVATGWAKTDQAKQDLSEVFREMRVTDKVKYK